MSARYYHIGRVPIAITSIGKTIALIHETIASGGKGYVCVSNMRTVTLANQDDDYFKVMENSLLNVPDGTPLVWCGKWWGLKDIEQVCGLPLFNNMLTDKEHGFKHYFLGDTKDTLSALGDKVEKTAGATVAGSYSPPFKPLEEYDLKSMAKAINESGANVVWTSLRAPKQDYLGQMLLPLLNNGIVVIGVGAAFRSYLGEYIMPDGLLHKAGLAGLGMMRNTTVWKEVKWYFKHSLALIGYFFTIKCRKLKGRTCDELFRGKHILVLEGYHKQVLPFLRGFKEQGCQVSVLCGSRLDCGYASRFPDHKILGICNPHKPEESEKNIIQLIKSGKYDMVFAPFDFSARILSHHKEELSSYAIIYANDRDVFDKANNKAEVMRICMENGIPCPRTYFGIGKVDDIDARIQFPVIIKPHSMYGARGFHLFHTADQMRLYVQEKKINLAEYVIQEFIPEGSMMMSGNVMIDRNGEVKSSYVYASEHLYPETGGTSTLNGIVDRPDIQENSEKLVKLLKLRGEIGVDFILDKRDNVGKVLEINPRPGHAATLGFVAGINHAQQILEDAFGLEVTPMEVKDKTTAVRIMQSDLLWFLSSKDRFSRQPKKLGYKRVKEQMFFWDDPLPWFAFSLSCVRDFRKKMSEKKQ